MSDVTVIRDRFISWCDKLIDKYGSVENFLKYGNEELIAFHWELQKEYQDTL